MTYEMIFGNAHPNWLVGALALVGLAWCVSVVFRVWLFLLKMTLRAA